MFPCTMQAYVPLSDTELRQWLDMLGQGIPYTLGDAKYLLQGMCVVRAVCTQSFVYVHVHVDAGC